MAAEPSGTDDRQYTIGGLDNTKTYNVALFPAEAVIVAADSTVTFADANTNDEADGAGATDAAITVINGTSRGGDTTADDMATAAPVNGQITFTVDYDGAAGPEQIRPVVWADVVAAGNTAAQLDLDANNAPTEPFGIGGVKSWVPAEAASGDFEVNVTLVNKTSDSFVGADDATVTATNTADDTGNLETPNDNAGTFFYDSNDAYFAGGVPVSMATFEANLSRGDGVWGQYAADPAAQSTFRLVDRNPGQPQNAAANAVSGTEITVTWDDPTTGSPTSFNIYRNAETCANTTAAELAKVGEVAGTATNEFKDTGLTVSTTYCYSVTAVQDGDESTLDATDDAGDSVAQATTLTAGQTAAPQSNDVYIFDDAGFPGEADSGDQWRILFSENVVVTDGDLIRVQDANGEFVSIRLSTTDTDGATPVNNQATWTQNGSAWTIGGTTYEAGAVLTVTLVDDPSGLSDADGNAANNTGRLEYPLTITNQSGINDDDTTNKLWTPSDDPDKVVDNEGAKAVTNPAPTMTSASASAATDDITVTYSEPVDCTTVQAADFDVTVATGTDETPAAATCTGASNTTVVLDMTTVEDFGAGVPFTVEADAANNVTDLDGVEQPATDSVSGTTAA